MQTLNDIEDTRRDIEDIRRGPKSGPHAAQLERRNHPYVVHILDKPEDCNWQHSVWDRGTQKIEVVGGVNIWFNSLVFQCAHILKNPSRAACICYKHGTKGDMFALFVDRVAFLEEDV